MSGMRWRDVKEGSQARCERRPGVLGVFGVSKMSRNTTSLTLTFEGGNKQIKIQLCADVDRNIDEFVTRFADLLLGTAKLILRCPDGTASPPHHLLSERLLRLAGPTTP